MQRHLLNQATSWTQQIQRSSPSLYLRSLACLSTHTHLRTRSYTSSLLLLGSLARAQERRRHIRSFAQSPALTRKSSKRENRRALLTAAGAVASSCQDELHHLARAVTTWSRSPPIRHHRHRLGAHKRFLIRQRHTSKQQQRRGREDERRTFVRSLAAPQYAKLLARSAERRHRHAQSKSRS